MLDAAVLTGTGGRSTGMARQGGAQHLHQCQAALTTLTYLSTATAPLGHDELVGLLESSRQHNEADAISGMLLYAGGHFIQTVEGPPDAVERLFARIVQDSRHRDVILALREPTRGRSFDGWSMGFEELVGSGTGEMPGFTRFLDAPKAAHPDSPHHGRAGIFHRVFRDRMR